MRVVFRGRPVPDARVEAYGPDQQPSWSRVTPDDPAPAATANTGPQGLATLEAERAGWWNVVAKPRGFAAARTSAFLASPPHDVDVTIRVRRGYALHGRVLDQAGAPVADVGVHAGSSMHPTARARRLVVSTRTDENGQYRLEGLPAGRLQIAPGDPPRNFVTVQCPFEGACDLVLRRRGSLAGRVTDVATSKPIPNARLRVESRGGIGYAVTDAEGRYRCDGLVREVFRIAVAAKGYVPMHPSGVAGPADGSLFLNPAGPRYPGRVTLAIPIRPGQTTAYDVALRRGAVITGVVRGPDGPLAGARVHLLTNRAQNGYVVAPVTSDAEGRYTFPGVLSGPALVRPFKEGYYDPRSSRGFWMSALQGKREAPNRVVVPAEGTVEHDVELVRGSAFEGVVLSEEGPVAGAVVFVHQPRPVDRSLRAASDADGSFRVEGLVPGRPVRVWAILPGFIPSEDKTFEAGAVSEVELRLVPLPRVRGRVTDTSGKPVVDALIRIHQDVKRSPTSEPHRELTDDDGTYERPLLGDRGTFRVEVRVPGRPDFTAAPVEATPDKRLYVVDVRLPEVTVLRGIVRTADGEPLPGALVRAGPTRRGTYSWLLPIQTSSGPDGAFEIPGPPAPRLALHVSRPGYRPVRLETASNEEPVVVLKPTRSIDGVVRGRDGKPASGLSVVAYPADGNRFDIYFVIRPVAVRSDGVPGRAEAITDGQGRFRVLDLDEGKYRLSAGPGSGFRAVGDLVVRSGTRGVVMVVEPATPGKFGSLTDEDAGRMARYLVLRGQHAKAIDVWRDLLTRNLGDATRTSVLIELAKSLVATRKHGDAEAAARKAAALTPASKPAGLLARYELARAILAGGRAEEALRLADEVAGGTSVDPGAAARGELVAALALIELGDKDAARKRLDRAGREAERLKDASLRVLVRNALGKLFRPR